MSYQWDNKKPTAQMLGRWQPFHEGHYTLFKEIIKKTGQVCIQIRDVQGVDDNPFDFETVKKNIEEKLNPEFEGRFKIMMVPNITNICYGRGVGYKIEEIVLPEEIQKISEKLEPKYKNRFKVVLVPNITNICYGRGVGYKIEEIVLPEEIQKISATKIRAKMREEGDLK